MSITATRIAGPDVPGATKFTVTDIALDDSYTSGGESVTADDLGLNTVFWAIATPNLTATTSINVAFAGYDEATSLLHVYNETPAEVSSTNDLKGLVVRVLAFGT